MKIKYILLLIFAMTLVSISKNLSKAFLSKQKVDFIKFEPDTKLNDLTLVKRITSSSLIETWLVNKLDEIGQKPFIAHFLMSTSAQKGFFAKEELDSFCANTNNVNSKAGDGLMRVLPCSSNKVITQPNQEGTLYYWLFDMPRDSNRLKKICRSDCATHRFCRYLIKDFINGFLKVKNYNTQNKIGIDIELNKELFYYGKLKYDNSDTKVPNYFIAIPFPKTKTLDEILMTDTQLVGLQPQKQKETLKMLSSFLVSMYNGFEDSVADTNIASAANTNLSKQNYESNLDVYEKIRHKGDPNKQVVVDEYLGRNEAFVKAYNSDAKSSQKDLDAHLKGSFYDFIYSLDSGSLANFNDAVAHIFLKNTKVNINKKWSDTNVLKNKPILDDSDKKEESP